MKELPVCAGCGREAASLAEGALFGEIRVSITGDDGQPLVARICTPMCIGKAMRIFADVAEENEERIAKAFASGAGGSG